MSLDSYCGCTELRWFHVVMTRPALAAFQDIHRHSLPHCQLVTKKYQDMQQNQTFDAKHTSKDTRWWIWFARNQRHVTLSAPVSATLQINQTLERICGSKDKNNFAHASRLHTFSADAIRTLCQCHIFIQNRSHSTRSRTRSRNVSFQAQRPEQLKRFDDVTSAKDQNNREWFQTLTASLIPFLKLAVGPRDSEVTKKDLS